MTPRIEPLLYSSIRINDCASIDRLLDAKSATFLGKAVKTLFIGHYPVSSRVWLLKAARLLSVCHRVDQIVAHTDVFYDHIASLRPRRLAIRRSCIHGVPHDDFVTLPPFSHLTHLEIYDLARRQADLSFHLLPRLTHLALHGNALYDIPVVFKTLLTCPNLEMIVLVTWGRDIHRIATLILEIIKVPRIFVLNAMHLRGNAWKGIVDGIDTWERARMDAAKVRR